MSKGLTLQDSGLSHSPTLQTESPQLTIGIQFIQILIADNMLTQLTQLIVKIVLNKYWSVSLNMIIFE